MDLRPLALIGLVLILAWNFLIGARFAAWHPSGELLRIRWMGSWLILLVGGGFIAADALGVRREAADSSQGPFLRRPPMALILLFLVMIVGGVHQLVLGVMYDVPSGVDDYLPLLGLVALLGIGLRWTVAGRDTDLDGVIAMAPLALFSNLWLTEELQVYPRSTIEVLWHPPVFFAWFGAILLVVGLRARVRSLVFAAGAYGLACLATYHFSGSPLFCVGAPPGASPRTPRIFRFGAILSGRYKKARRSGSAGRPDSLAPDAALGLRPRRALSSDPAA